MVIDGSSVKYGVLIKKCRSLVVSARRSFFTGQIAWKRGLWMKKVVIYGRGSFLRGSFGPGTTVVVF